MLEFDVVFVTSKPRVPRGMLESCGSAGIRITAMNNSPHSGMFIPVPGIREINVGENAGWVRAANAGLSLATAPHVVLMNDDVEVCCPDWLEKLREPLVADSKIAAVGPRSNTASTAGRLKEGPWRKCQEVNLRYDGEGRGDYDPGHHWAIGSWPLSFFCVMFSQEALKDVGLLDPGLADWYGGDDDDWQRRAWERGWSFAYQPEVLVKHDGRDSYKGDKAALQAKSIEYLRKKWGRG